MTETKAKPKIKFLADECTFVQTVRLMRDLGCEVQRIQELGMTGAEDPVVFRKAQEMGAVLVTNDKGFGDIRDFPPSSHHGVIVLKMLPEPGAVQAVHRVLRGLLEEEEKFQGILFTVDTHKYRKRKRS
ncbi:MAG: DUF5615 family PIN-like protein [Candidatus Methanosuratincola petrocarbonis]